MNVCVPQKDYKSRVVYFSAVEFFKQHGIYGFRCQVSGVSVRQQKSDDRGQIKPNSRAAHRGCLATAGAVASPTFAMSRTDTRHLTTETKN